MLRWINGFVPKAAMNPKEERRAYLAGISIRTSLLLGFGAMSGVMLLATSIAFFSTARVSESIRIILDERLPVMSQTLRVARATDALAATGIQLASVKTDVDRRNAFQRLDTAVNSLEQALVSLADTTTGADDVRNLANELIENLHVLTDMADQRIYLEQKHQDKRELLLSNLQGFKQHLTYRVRILEGDSDVIWRLLSRPSPPMERVVELMKNSSQQIPVSRFYTEVEIIAGRAMAAIQDSKLTTLALSQQILEIAFRDATITYSNLPPGIVAELGNLFTDLQEIVKGRNGLLMLREQELKLQNDSQHMIDENQRITALVDSAISDLVGLGFDTISQAGQATDEMRHWYMLLLTIATGFGLLVIAALMHFHVMRHVICRLSWLSEAMQQIAAGRLDTSLPPVGNDELGRLGFAVRQFQKTAADADRRESDLLISKQMVERAKSELEQKAMELESANDKLEKLSETDFLTGLANRRRFDQVLQTEWSRARRANHPLSLIMMDVDHFKKFNDRYGHQAGDVCLKNLASVLMGNLYRAGDLMARYGGEEFCVISAYTDSAAAQALAEKIRREVKALGLIHEDSEFGVVTISLGIAVVIPDHTKSPEELIRAADAALYEAKACGRNCVRTSAQI